MIKVYLVKITFTQKDQTNPNFLLKTQKTIAVAKTKELAEHINEQITAVLETETEGNAQSGNYSKTFFVHDQGEEDRIINKINALMVLNNMKSRVEVQDFYQGLKDVTAVRVEPPEVQRLVDEELNFQSKKILQLSEVSMKEQITLIRTKRERDVED